MSQQDSWDADEDEEKKDEEKAASAQSSKPKKTAPKKLSEKEVSCQLLDDFCRNLALMPLLFLETKIRTGREAKKREGRGGPGEHDARGTSR